MQAVTTDMPQFLKIVIPAPPDVHEVLMAELSFIKFDSFQENESDLHAFILEGDFDEASLGTVLSKYGVPLDFQVERLEDINWNEQWESNFSPVFIEDQVQIRADFHHPRSDIKYDVIINPKMSFGTGHHETTCLMVEEQLNIEHIGKQVLDVGTGTGILAIMAHKLGAHSIIATDIDDWSIENCRENFAANDVQNVTILRGSIHNLTLKGNYDIIYANINKNVLVEELPKYARLLKDGGTLLLSGFYSEDMADLIQLASFHNLKPDHHKTRNNWAMLRLSFEIV